MNHNQFFYNFILKTIGQKCWLEQFSSIEYQIFMLENENVSKRELAGLSLWEITSILKSDSYLRI
jgi:hypothetical protein